MSETAPRVPPPDTGTIPRAVTIPIQSPNPVDDDDIDRLYALTDEATCGNGPEGAYVTFAEDSGTASRVLTAMRQAGFRTVLDEVTESTRPHEDAAAVRAHP